MANNVYVVNLLAAPGPTVTVSDDGTGIDEIRVTGVYSQVVDITLAWVWTSGQEQASGTYFPNPLPDNSSGRLVVQGIIENARGSNGRDDIIGNVLANVIFGDAARTGPGADDVISADDGNDTAFGGAGADTIGGAAGNDRLYGDDGSDTINGNAGADLVEGGAGADILSGGSDSGDTVSYAASNAAVNVRITFGQATAGSGGHAAGDQITGFANVIGSDFNDLITDTVKGAVAFGGNNNSFSGRDGNDRLSLGGGNDVGKGGIGNDTLLGEAGSDRLDGNAGADRMSGGLGNDIFYVDSALDKVFEAANQGTDTVYASASYALATGQHIETLTTASLAGTGSMNLTGNELAQRINGNNGSNAINGGGGNDALFGYAGNDLLAGGAGNDTLAGGGGGDFFVFNTTLNATTNVDRILDFNVAADTIRLDNAVMPGLGAALGMLAAAKFWKSATGLAHDADDRVVYETDTGRVFYDSNGNANGGAIHVATLVPNLGLTNADFQVI